MSNQPAVSKEEAAALYRRALRGEIPVTLTNPLMNWNSVYCGNVEFMFADYKVTLFNDCYELDYTDAINAPDGRRSEFSDWCTDDHIGCPLDLLDHNERYQLEVLVENLR